jgi:DNA-binding GntR family transcriptional regulator
MNTPIEQEVSSEPITLADRVFFKLRQAIVEGEIAAGSKISEPELAKTFGISRSSLREAISRLEACSLVTRKANVGARVADTSTEQLLEIFEIREALEGMAARLAATQMSELEIENLKELLISHENQLQEEQGKAYFQKAGDLDFHYRVIQGSKNARLIHLLCEDLYYQIRRYRYQYGMRSQRATRAFIEHKYIVDAIESRDGELAETLMRSHIRQSKKNVENYLQNKLQQNLQKDQQQRQNVESLN